MRSRSIVSFALVALLLSLAFGASAQIEDCGSWTIGVSNSFVGSEWRTQMVADIEQTAEPVPRGRL